jgi:hypothetical protein
MNTNPTVNFKSMCDTLKGNREHKWINLGGQLIPEKDVDQIRSDIGCGKLSNWDEIHQRYDTLWERYPFEKQKHAFAALCEILRTDNLTREQWVSALDKVEEIQEFISDQVYISRKKDFENPFRKITYRNTAEMKAATGTIEDNSFVKQVRKETDDFKKLTAKIKSRD